MSNYDFRTLSSHDFENCVRDLLQSELGILLETFKSGRDGGIDLRYSNDQRHELIVQCKHYAESGYDVLYRDLKNSELPKVIALKPERYILATSVGLSPSTKDKIVKLFSPYCKSPSDVYGKEDLNNLLGRHPDIEKKHFKLWLSSSRVLSQIVHSKIFNYSETEIERIRQKIKIYVQNDSFFKATELLEDLHYCIIAGIPGIGKTTLAEILLVHYLRLGYEPIKISNDIGEAYAVLDQHKKQIFYYDDFLGQTALADKLNKNEDDGLLRFLETVNKSKTMKLILTTREYILAQAKASHEKLANSSFDRKKCVIDLKDYTTFHKAKILYNHIYFSDLQKEYRDAILQKQAYMKILSHPNFNPRIIEWMTASVEVQGITPSTYVEMFLSSLNNPSRIWQHAFDKQLSNPSRHVLLVLVSLPDEIILTELERAFNSFYGFRSRGQRFSIDPRDFMIALKELEGNFVQIDKFGESFTIKFHNPSIRDFLGSFLQENVSYLKDLIASATFFEQITRLWGGSSELERSGKTRQALKNMRDDLGEAIKRLLDSEECSLVNKSRIVSFESRAICALDISLHLKLNEVTDAIFSRLTEHVSSKCNRFGLDSLLAQITKKGIKPPSEFISAVKEVLIDDISDLDEFESVMDFGSLFPGSISKDEKESLRLDFELRYERMVEKVLDQAPRPDELRRCADLLEDLGNRFSIDVRIEYDSLREQADEDEKNYDGEEEGDYSHWRSDSVDLGHKEDEIHSMFDGLRDET